MRVPILVLLAGAALAVALPRAAVAQEDDQTYVYASYYRCAPGSISDAVENIDANWTPVIQEHIDAGHVASWGALTHQTGNAWSLVLYHLGSDLDALSGAIGAGVEQLYDENPEAGSAFAEACPSHEDYVWMSVAGSEPMMEAAQDRAEAAMSVYWTCHEGREAIADLIFEELMAPALDEQIEAGLVNSWGWMEHYLGGKYRRLLTMDGADQASLLEARSAVLEAFAGEPGLAAAFSEVCDGHQDNLYQVAISRP